MPRPRAGIAPGAVHVPGWLSLTEQAGLVRAYHGVPRTLPGTGPDGIGLPSGRLNITLRESGLTAAG